MWNDIRFGARMLAKKPTFTIIALLALGLGIRASTTTCSVVNGLLLKPSPYIQDQNRGGSGVLLAVGGPACYLPARAATRLNPVEALRYE